MGLDLYDEHEHEHDGGATLSINQASALELAYAHKSRKMETEKEKDKQDQRLTRILLLLLWVSTTVLWKVYNFYTSSMIAGKSTRCEAAQVFQKTQFMQCYDYLAMTSGKKQGREQTGTYRAIGPGPQLLSGLTSYWRKGI